MRPAGKVGQDNLRRIVLRERDVLGGAYIVLVDTVARYALDEYGRTEMSAWYRGSDLLSGGIEHVIPATSTLDATVRRILRDTGLPAPGIVALALPPG